MSIELSAKVKELYDYMDKIYNFSSNLMEFLETTISNINKLKDSDDVSVFLRELAEKDLKPFYLRIKQRVETVNTPIRIVKKGFNKIYNEKLNELISFLNFIRDNLQIIFKKIEDFQESLISKRSNFKSFSSYIQDYDLEIENYLITAIHRVVHNKIVYFETELEKIKAIQEPNQIILFLQGFKENVNRFITEHLYENISGLFGSLKDTVLKKVESYLDELDIPKGKKDDLMYKIEVYLKGYETIYPVIYFEIPSIPSDFFDPSTKYKTAIDRFMENIFSFRFFFVFFIGLVMTLFGVYETYYEENDISFIISLMGIFFVFLSLFDAMFFNRKYVKNFLEEKKSILLLLIKENLEKIEEITRESMIEQKNNLVKGINELILEEFEIYSLGGEKLENLKENIKKFKEEVYNLLNQLNLKLEEDVT